ncbi:MAG: histone deacetylase [Thermoanaerobaculia bacterium]|nr:histone deacetylase [Thermoanaerobaculia bacterium]
MTSIAYSDAYAVSVPDLPMDPLRGEKVLISLAAQRALHRVNLIRAPKISFRHLLAVHDRDYLSRFEEPGSMTEAIGRTLNDHQRLRLLSAQRAMVGGTLRSTRSVLASSGIAVNLGGGLHHARRDRGGGFCLFNDLAVAITAVRDEGLDAPILVVDLDLHDGDGTRLLFARDSSVFTYSIHNQNWAETEASSSLSIDLGSEVSDDLYLDTLERTLPEVFHRHQPRLAFFVAGTDPAASDTLGDWKISDTAFLRRDRFVLDLLREIPTVMVLGGGYGGDAWRPTARVLSYYLTGTPREPLASEEATLRHYRALASLVDPVFLESRTVTDDPLDWGLSEQDLTGALGHAPKHRFLDYYTPHGIELALEINGVLQRIRDLGYAAPQVDLDLDSVPGETLQVWGEPERENLIIELRVRRDHASLPDRELLFVEWLLLQHPKGQFSATHPRLPGQVHPGLGMLKDALALLVVISDRLELDGIAFIPSHFHLAAQSHQRLRFLDPRSEAQLRSIEASFPQRSLRELSHDLSRGELVDESGNVEQYTPSLMVLPISSTLERDFGEAYEREVEQALRPVFRAEDPSRHKG